MSDEMLVSAVVTREQYEAIANRAWNTRALRDALDLLRASAAPTGLTDAATAQAERLLAVTDGGPVVVMPDGSLKALIVDQLMWRNGEQLNLYRLFP